MIIHQPELIKRNQDSILFSKIELKKTVDHFPVYLWFRVPNQYAEFISIRSDAFLLPCLLAAMHLREDITVRGDISPRLAYHLSEYQYILNLHYPTQVFPVEITYDRLAPLVVHPQAVGTAFSGGVDSFFTIKKHTSESQPSKEYRITHAIFINKFDIVSKESSRYLSLFQRYKKALEKIDVELIQLETNALHLIVPRMKLARFYLPAIAGSALTLSGLFKRFIISNSWDYYQLRKIPNSSNPLSDRLLSTESLDFEHFGANYRRTEKIYEISNFKLAQDHLRVCGYTNLGENVLNCSRCGKCIRTMIPIYLLGKMNDFSTFLKPLKSNRDILRWARKFEPYPVFLPENFIMIRKTQPRLLPLLWLTILLGYLWVWTLALIPGFLKSYLTRFGHFSDHFKEDGAFENLEILREITFNDIAKIRE